ncbi:hypothetical protein [Psychromonas aquatilis]|uniref:Outer membrane lipoprotein-sorting protein n=1 Tax=Psychromonas aquatilis TaxID=2005072 RepID=A0ABU9GL82_9GAMM
MKKTITTIMIITTALITMSNANAKKIDLSNFTDSCVKSYKQSQYRNGTSEINGVYLEYLGKDNINSMFSSLYFSPDYNLNVMFNNDFKQKKATYDLTEKNNVFTFYNRKEKYDGDRNGLMFEIKKIDSLNYKLKVFKTNHNILNNKQRFVAVFDELFPLGKNRFSKEDLYSLDLTRNFEKENSMFYKNTELTKGCLKR